MFGQQIKMFLVPLPPNERRRGEIAMSAYPLNFSLNVALSEQIRKTALENRCGERASPNSKTELQYNLNSNLTSPFG
jgi:hypothetical protein